MMIVVLFIPSLVWKLYLFAIQVEHAGNERAHTPLDGVGEGEVAAVSLHSRWQPTRHSTQCWWLQISVAGGDEVTRPGIGR